jgi:hypothetical protein
MVTNGGAHLEVVIRRLERVIALMVSSQSMEQLPNRRVDLGGLIEVILDGHELASFLLLLAFWSGEWIVWHARRPFSDMVW